MKTKDTINRDRKAKICQRKEDQNMDHTKRNLYSTQEIDLALHLGYNVEISWIDGSKFTRARRTVWKIRDEWQTANHTHDGGYTGLMKFDNLKDALKRPLHDI